MIVMNGGGGDGNGAGDGGEDAKTWGRQRKRWCLVAFAIKGLG